MRDPFPRNVDAFLAFLEEISLAAEFVELSRTLRPHLMAVLDWNGPTHIVDLVTKFVNRKGVRLDLVYRSLYANSHAALEQYVNRLVVTVVESVNLAEPKYDDLGDQLVKEHIYRTGKALATIHEPVDYRSFNYSSLIEALAGCRTGANTVSLNSEAFLLKQTNLNTKSIKRLFKRVQIDVDWTEVCKDTPLQTYLKTEGPQATKNLLEETLTEMVRNRNRIVHTGGAAADISFDILKSQLYFIPVFASSFTGYIEGKLKTLTGSS